MKRSLSILAALTLSGAVQAAIDPMVPSWKAVLEGKLEGSMLVSLERANPYGIQAQDFEQVTLKSLGETFGKTPYGVSSTSLYEPSFFTVLCALPQSRLSTEAIIWNTLRSAGYQPGPSRSVEAVQQMLWLSAGNTAPHMAAQIEYKCGANGGYAQVAVFQVGTPEQMGFSQKRYQDLLQGSKGADEVVGVNGVTSLRGVRLLSDTDQTLQSGAVPLRLRNTTSRDVKVSLRVVLYNDKGQELKTLKRAAIVIGQGSLDLPLRLGDARAVKARIRILDVQPYEGAEGDPIQE